MNPFIESLAVRLRGRGERVVFVECEDKRILRTARMLADGGVCVPVLLGDPAAVAAAAEGLGIDLAGIEVVDAADEAGRAALAARYHEAVPTVSEKRALRKAASPLQCAAMMVKVGDADCLAAGVVHSTGEVIVAAQQFIGMAEGISIPSSLGYLDLDVEACGPRRWVGITDCAVNTDPDAAALADIVLASAASYEGVFGRAPRVAMLSYSTCGSADGPSVERVREAIGLVRAAKPELSIDGEFQLEVALVPALAERKLHGRTSDVAGRADIVVFPSLDAGNIAVKCMQIFGDVVSPGPVLQGFARPVTDFSRSAKTEDVFANVVIALSQGGAR